MVSEVEGFKLTTSIKKLRKLRKRTKVVPGGTSAGKTYGILPLLIDEAIKIPYSEISVVSESIPHLRKGALKDFLKIMRVTGRYVEENYNKTQLIYTFANGSYIEFFSADQEDKVRGPRRTTLYINECNNLSFDTYHQLAIRTSRSIWLDFNPSNEFWVYSEVKEDDDTEWLTLTYKDNEALADSIVKEIEKAKYKAFIDPEGNLFDENNVKNAFWANWWKVYGMGLLGSLEGVIFSNWTTIEEIPETAKLLGLGLDWGWNHVNAATALYEWGDKYILHEVLYKAGMDNKSISESLPYGETIFADSAEPKSIAELKGLGHNIKPIKKGPDSVNFGIQLMQQQEFLITSASTNLIKEFRQYCWDEDKYGNKLNKPVKVLDDGVDSARYACMGLIGKRKRKAKFGWNQ